jgi:plastocyanin
MHTAVLQLAPILGAEKSKVPFFIAGGVLVAWAFLLSLGLGLRLPAFPGSLGGQRIVMAISAVLVLVTLSAAVLTSGTPANAGTREPPVTLEPPPAPLPSPAAPAASASPAASAGSGAPASATATPAPAGALKLAANPAGQLSYNTKTLSAKAGTVTIVMANMAPVEHNVTVAQGSKVLGATPTFTGGTRTLSLKLKPGKYTFYCSVPGHRQAGMEGTLNVS